MHQTLFLVMQRTKGDHHHTMKRINVCILLKPYLTIMVHACMILLYPPNVQCTEAQ